MCVYYRTCVHALAGCMLTISVSDLNTVWFKSVWLWEREEPWSACTSFPPYLAARI